MITIYGRVTEIEATEAPPATEPPPDPPITYAAAAEVREVGVPPKNWVHVHIVLDPPSAGELEINAPEQHVSGLLAVDGRCRVIFDTE